VIVPCFNDGVTLPETVASIDEIEPIEVVVVDDGSSDLTTKTVLDGLEAEGVRVIHHEHNRGLIEARMTGLAATSAPFVFPLDADDCAVAGALGAMADALDADPGAALCFGDYLEFGESNFVRAVPPSLDPFRLTYTNEYPISALIRRTELEAVDGWRFSHGTLGAYEDWNLWMKLAERGARGVYFGPGRITYRRRLHPAGEMRMLDAGRADHSHLYEQLREAHPGLFERVREHRRASDLSLVRKLAYPYVYGGRKRRPFERRVKAALDRLGVWTLRR
jgi:glycosyltransferase involved in cell wall biosynthesis